MSFRQHEIEQHEIGLMLIEAIDSFIAIAGLDHVESVVAQILGEHFTHHRFVVDDQNQLRAGHDKTVRPDSHRTVPRRVVGPVLSQFVITRQAKIGRRAWHGFVLARAGERYRRVP